MGAVKNCGENSGCSSFTPGRLRVLVFGGPWMDVASCACEAATPSEARVWRSFPLELNVRVFDSSSWDDSSGFARVNTARSAQQR